MEEIRLYAGFDPRESIGLHTFAQSLWETSPGVSITAITGDQGDGTNAFTYKRFDLFLEGTWSLFVDGADMLLRESIRKLWALRDKKYAVQVVKHDYQTKHEKKYIGTELEAPNSSYERKNWSSVMLINGSHWSHHNHGKSIRAAIREKDGAFLHRFAWLDDEEIGSLPIEWNWLADEYGVNDEAKLLHWTCGLPGFYQYRDTPHSQEWQHYCRKVTRGLQ